MAFKKSNFVKMILLIIILFLLSLTLSASDSHIALIIDIGMEGGLGGSDWYMDYYNWFLAYPGIETYIVANLFILIGYSLVFYGFFLEIRFRIKPCYIN